ncbi:MAG: tRNA (adenosine(37)-N6)-threonylcarbamoyltransferase complex ATPase subunit type 1 TsaE [Candidatus Woesebacteria bacterium]|nr:tRNA (adenosine(37)-N6)-threonylcarbamoyltransferase complex ATPase subunit type 1 TsaE [Candidatus Woesebacteria bacterium]
MQIVKENPNVVGLAVNVLKKGGLVVFPCETTYGIAADATNLKAVKKLNSYKKRPIGKPYSIAVSNIKMAEKYVSLNSTARNIYKEFLPGPITVVSYGKHEAPTTSRSGYLLPTLRRERNPSEAKNSSLQSASSRSRCFAKGDKLAKGIESETGTLGVRISSYLLVNQIVKILGFPITATSANASYMKRPYRVSDILDNISEKQKSLIDLIINAGELPHNEPSTVIDTTLDDPVILRQGKIKFKDKNEVFSGSEENTQNIAKELFQKYENYLGKRPIIFALIGEMGSGKTQFTKGLGKVLGIKEEIVSPTFNFVLEYKKLTHIDAWRLQKPEELNTLGFLKMIEDKNMVIAIEWADRVINEIKNQREHALVVWVKIKYGKRGNERLISWGVI